MALSLLVVFSPTLLILSALHSVQSQPSFPGKPSFAYSKWGIGPCPKVKPMKDFDVTKLYGGSWYLIAHYFDGYLSDRHCLAMQYFDDNPGKDICRVLINRTSVEYDDGEIKAAQIYFLLPNETEHSIWIFTVHDVPSKMYVLDTDYDDYLIYHSCNQFPRDNPFLYEQHNYIVSRTPEWPDVYTTFQKALKGFEEFNIDTRPFLWMDQQYCTRAPEPVPEPSIM